MRIMYLSRWIIICFAGISIQCASLAAMPLGDSSKYESEKNTKNLIVYDKNSNEYHFKEGLLALNSNRLDKAKIHFSNIPISSKLFNDARNNLAVIYSMEGDYQKSKKILEETIRFNSSLDIIYRNIIKSKAYLFDANVAAALDVLNKNPKSKPNLIVSTAENYEFSKEIIATRMNESDVKNSDAAVTTSTSATIKNPDSAPVLQSPRPLAPTLEAKRPNETPQKPHVLTGTANPNEVVSPANIPALIAEDTSKSASHALVAWAKAWSDKNLDQYFASYSHDFTPADGKNLTEWKSERVLKIKNKNRIQVKLTNIETDVISTTRVNLKFQQAYSSSGYKSSSAKLTEMKLEGGRWLIIREIVQK